MPHHDEWAVHVITTGALRRLGEMLGGPVDPARFRANVLLDTDHGRILQALGEAGDPIFGLQASVVRGGTMRCGDPAVLR